MGGYTVERSITVNAPSHRVHGLIDDFHNWTRGRRGRRSIPTSSRSYSGPDKGVGARYDWSGNRKAGMGNMEIKGSTPEGIDITVAFLKPFKATNQTRLSLEPSGSAPR